VRTSRIGRTSVTNAFAAYRVEDDLLMCTATQSIVLVDAVERRSVPIAEGYRRMVREFEGADLEEPA
jgi:acyl-CoA thioesterase FadM